MESYKRFTDENYKNWLKTAESLYILRGHIREFVENETETYHKSLREKLNGKICVKKCTIKKNSPQGKKVDICDACERWKAAILANCKSKGVLHWENCEPNLWPTEKWEVAKVYMPRTPRDNRSFDEFDISAILNYMDNCSHFKTFKIPHMNKVINVRNKVMHSPELRLSKTDTDNCIANVVQLAKALEAHAPGLKAMSKEIQQFTENLEKYCVQKPVRAEDSKEGRMKLMHKEHQALKEKIEFLAKQYEEQKDPDLEKEFQGIKSFLDQNKDLLENLGPHVNQLNEIQEKVKKHDRQIVKLEDRVEKLEMETQDPVLIGDPIKFKNHLLEEAKKRKWPDPVFTEVRETNGYRGQVEVNGKSFIGSNVCNSKKLAHQDVAKKALDNLNLCQDSTEDLSQPGCTDKPSKSSAVPSVTTATSSSESLFYATATVVLKNQEVVSDGYARKEHATESAYEKLACLFGLKAHEEGNSFRAVVLEHFDRCHYPPPSEHLDQQDDKTVCKLLLSGSFTFHDTDGSIRKKQTEQQVAMIALHQLSGILNCSPETVDDGNYKGFLKERMDAYGLSQPLYSTERKEGIGEEVKGPSSSGVHCTGTLKMVSKNASLQPEEIATVVQPPPTEHQVDDDVHLTGTQGTETPPIPCKVAKLEFTEIDTLLALFNLKPPSVTVESVHSEQKFIVRVEVILDNLTFRNKEPCTSKKEAIRKAYYSLGCALGICQSNTDAVMLVKQNFSQNSFSHPKEVIDGNKENFYCSLMNISYNVVYEGQGSTEEDARADGLQKALSALPLLFGYESLPSCGSAEEMKEQMNTILRNKGQKDLTYSLQQHCHKRSAKLFFRDYTMKNTNQSNKRANHNHLSRRMLGLLGEETERNCPSFKSCLYEWFAKSGMKAPVLEDTDEALGCKATFSVSLSCSHSDWEDSLEAANKKLIQELNKRFTYLIEKDAY